MFSGRALKVLIIPINTLRHILTVSHASKTPSLSSCISLLYAKGKPLRTVSSDIRSPYTRPVFPLTSSAMSGFFFCGMIDEPVVKLSESSMNLNSQLDHSTISSENLERCIMIIAISPRSSAQKSLSDTPSILFMHTPSKPSFSASNARFVMYVVPASAQEPIGETFSLLLESVSLSISRKSIMEYAMR